MQTTRAFGVRCVPYSIIDYGSGHCSYLTRCIKVGAASDHSRPMLRLHAMFFWFLHPRVEILNKCGWKHTDMTSHFVHASRLSDRNSNLARATTSSMREGKMRN